MADSSTQSIVIDAAPAQVAAVICDFPRYPEWAQAMKRVEVLEEYEDGYASQVRFALDAGVLRRRVHAAVRVRRGHLAHRVAPGRAVRRCRSAQDGSYDIDDNGDGTSTVTYTLAVELADRHARHVPARRPRR